METPRTGAVHNRESEVHARTHAELAWISIAALASLACCSPSSTDAGLSTDAAAAAEALRIPFTDQEPGAPPRGWHVGTTGLDGPHATWQVLGEGEDRHLALVAANHDSSKAFNLCWSDDLRLRDGTVALRLRADGGEIDQGGGPMWRVRDARNYYVARYNPLESNFRVYCVLDGVRTMLKGAEDIDLPAGEWFEIRVEHAGAHVACWLNGQKLLEADSAELPEAGGVGAWTKADARTSFDDLEVRPAH